MTRVCSLLVPVALVLSTSPTVQAQSAGAPARPLPPAIPARVLQSQCTYGGSIPAFTLSFELEAQAPVHDLRVATIYLRAASGNSFAAVRGPVTLRVRAPSAGASPSAPTAFSGDLSAGQRVHLEAFGRLEMAAFGRGASYPDAELPYELALTAGGSVLYVRGPRCVVIPGG